MTIVSNAKFQTEGLGSTFLDIGRCGGELHLSCVVVFYGEVSMDIWL